MIQNIGQRQTLVPLPVLIVAAACGLAYDALFRGRETCMDRLYMTVTGVGFGKWVQVTGNPPAKTFTLLLMAFGMGIIIRGIDALTALLIEGERTGMPRQNTLRKKIRKRANLPIVRDGGAAVRPLLVAGAKKVF